jgi:putative transposase
MGLTMTRRCELLGINRSTAYFKPKEKTPDEILLEEKIKSRIDYWHNQLLFAGVRKIRKHLTEDDGYKIGRKLVRRYMSEMNIYAIYPKPNLSKPAKQSIKCPYLLKNKNIAFPNQVWAIDITYISLGRSHMYLTAVIDWYSRYIVGWTLSDTLETAPIIETVQTAIAKCGTPAIINSDQGSQFTSNEYMNLLRSKHIAQSMDGKARWVDNVIIERFFRSLKCDDIYFNEYKTPRELLRGISDYINKYNNVRRHAGLNYARPRDEYFSAFSRAA